MSFIETFLMDMNAMRIMLKYYFISILLSSLVYSQELVDTISIKSESLSQIQNSVQSKSAKQNSLKYNPDDSGSPEKSYVIRFGIDDTDPNVEFYGLSIAVIQNNYKSIFNGIIFNGILGELELNKDKSQPQNYLSVNGVNLSMIGTGVSGTINGIAFGGLVFQNANEVNGISCAWMGTNTTRLNGLALAIFNFTEYGNGIQFGIIGNGYKDFNGFGFAAINSGNKNSIVSGIIFGLLNINLNVRGISFGVLNDGNSWLQIGIFNGGDCIIQIGLINLDGDGDLGIPIINVNF